MDLQKLWKELYTVGYGAGLNGTDSLITWQHIRVKLLGHYAFIGLKEIQLVDSFLKLSKSVNYTTNFYDFDHQNATIQIGNIEVDNKGPNHFFIQHFRIPIMANFLLSILEIAQIAYHSGRFMAECEKNVYDETIIQFYKQHQLSRLSTFVNVNPPIAERRWISRF